MGGRAPSYELSIGLTEESTRQLAIPSEGGVCAFESSGGKNSLGAILPAPAVPETEPDRRGAGASEVPEAAAALCIFLYALQEPRAKKGESMKAKVDL